MKKRFADLHVRNRIKDAKVEITSTSINQKDFTGDLYFYQFNDVTNRFVLPNGVCLIDNNYKWLEFYDYSSKVKLTAMYDENNKIIEWYFDIAKEIGKENGLAYEDDLYLDVLLTNKKEIVLLDEDELKDALDKMQITQIEFDGAYKEAYQLMERLKGKKDELQKFTDKYLKLMLGDN